jgi:8-oxo-dGTP pyrophosphatase MutT (NUDIX family)
MKGIKNKSEVVTCFLKKGDKILILKRSDKVSTYKRKWAGISGYIEEKEEPLETALKEIEEEVGLKGGDVELVKEGKTISFIDEIDAHEWIVHPFLFNLKKVKKGEIKINWEHIEYKWVHPSEIYKYETVPKLKEAMKGILSNPP